MRGCGKTAYFAARIENGGKQGLLVWATESADGLKSTPFRPD
jgi:hypothetical protein